MRPRHVLTAVAVGLAARAIVRRRRAHRAAAARTDFAADPDDPVQNLDELELQPELLDIDAVPVADVEAAQNLAGIEVHLDDEAEAEAEQASTGLDDAAAREAPDAGDAGAAGRRRDAGDLYGAHTPAAIDREHPDDDRAFDTGQNWLEALETSAIENGPELERELDDIVDDEDILRPPHASDTRDTPVADHGAGGRRGL
jgi:hypothetical protein